MPDSVWNPNSVENASDRTVGSGTSSGEPQSSPLPSVKDIHDRVADAYFGKLGAVFMRQTQRRVHWICERAQGSRVLDVGCSQGIVSVLLAREGKSVLGIDSDPKSIVEANELRDTHYESGCGEASFVRDEFLSHDFTDQRFETVVMSEVLEHLVRPEEFIAKAAALLVDDGTIVVTVPFGVNDFFDHKRTYYLFEPYRLLSKHFEVREVAQLGDWIGFVGRRLGASEARPPADLLQRSLVEHLEQGFFDLERRLRDEVGSLTTRLTDANLKYRAATEQATTLKQRVTREEQTRIDHERTIARLEARLDEAEKTNARGRAKRRKQKQRIDELRIQLAIAEQSASQARSSLEAAEAQSAEERAAHLAATERLRSRLEAERDATHEADKTRLRLESELASAENRLAHVTEALRASQAEAEANEKDLRALMAERDGNARALDQANDWISRHRAEADAMNGELANARQRLEQLEELASRLQASLAAAEQDRRELATRAEESRALEARLKEATQKNEAATKALERARAETSRLGSELETAAARERAQGAELERLKVDVLRSRIATSEAQTRNEQARQQVLAARQQAEKTRNTLSFQLGHTLIFGLKSWDGFKEMPHRLLELREEAQRRREVTGPSRNIRRQAKNAVPAPLEAPSTGPSAAPPPPGTAFETSTLGLARMLKALKVASIMDEFTYGSFKDECNLLQLTPEHWNRELETFRPELLFIESAWRGKDELWGNKVGHASREVQEIVRWCRDHGIPSVFWNKEDPVHFETFLSTAKLFDYVFTTDIDCIHRYKAALGHERVYFLPFACQPRVNNPIEPYERKDAFCFAGAYYVRYPDRTRDLGNFIASLPDFRPVEIYDRNYGKTDPNYQFPPEYQPFIVGNLPFDQIDKAYKGYRFAINLNSIKQSQSMFARRVYELLGSNTITVSNYSRGLRLMFGDLVVTSDSGIEVMRRLRALCGDETSAAKLRLAALRKAMSEHTYQDRLAYVVAKVRGVSPGSLLPRFVVLGYAKNDAQANAIVESFERQSFGNKSLVLVVPGGFNPTGLPSTDRVRVIAAPDAERLRVSELGGADDWLSVMVPDDYYGPNYLLDLALATRYTECRTIGKDAHFAWSASKELRLDNRGREYRPAESVAARSGAARLDSLDANLREWVSTLYTARFGTGQALAIDAFNYCRNAAASGFGPDQIAIVNDATGIDTGIPLPELIARAEQIAPAEQAEDPVQQIRGVELAELFRKPPSGTRVQLSVDGTDLQIDSTLDDGKHEYWYATRDHTPEALGANGSRLKLHVDLTPGLNVQLALFFLDQQKQRISHAIKTAGRNHDVELPPGSAFVKLALRLYGPGSARVRSIVLGHRALEPADVLGRAEHLLLTNHYPSDDDLYRNGFVHRRVVAYRQRGTRVDVFRLRPDATVGYHEFEDIDCITGSAHALDQMLATGRYQSVLVHFLDEKMWRVLSRHVDRVKVTVWVHGAEIQPVHRREYNYRTPEERAAAKAESDARMAFWRGLLRPMPQNLRLVFVSRYFAEEVMEDLGFRLPESGYEIIHNPIDTELFFYEPKAAEQRKKILSIRPYASAKYANDLSVQTILQLSKRTFFGELEFRLIGDGPLFDETLGPVRSMPNVIVERRFLTQDEIAKLHREYGIFLCPTRMDAQGVSRDEAMSSGLVPVTNAVAAIPEFVDGECGILAPADDAITMASGIARLAESEELFTRLSQAAAKRVRSQSCVALTVSRELELFTR